MLARYGGCLHTPPRTSSHTKSWCIILNLLDYQQLFFWTFPMDWLMCSEMNETSTCTLYVSVHMVYVSSVRFLNFLAAFSTLYMIFNMCLGSIPPVKCLFSVTHESPKKSSAKTHFVVRSVPTIPLPIHRGAQLVFSLLHTIPLVQLSSILFSLVLGQKSSI